MHWKESTKVWNCYDANEQVEIPLRKLLFILLAGFSSGCASWSAFDQKNQYLLHLQNYGKSSDSICVHNEEMSSANAVAYAKIEARLIWAPIAQLETTRTSI